MPEDRNILIEDADGNQYFPHTKATNVAVSDGSSADNALKAANAATSAAAANRIIQRDASGRAKVAAPAATDDIARKAEVDAINSDKIHSIQKNSKNNDSLITDFPIGHSVMRLDTPLGFPVSAGTLSTYRPESAANGFQIIVNTGGGTWIYTRKTLNGVFSDWEQTVTKLNGVIQGPLEVSGSKIKVTGTWAGYRIDAAIDTSAEMDMMIDGTRRALVNTNSTETEIRRYAADGATIESRFTVRNDRLILNGTDLFRRANSPEGNQAAAPGSLCVVWSTTDAGLWIKANGTGNAGWRKAAYV